MQADRYSQHAQNRLEEGETMKKIIVIAAILFASAIANAGDYYYEQQLREMQRQQEFARQVQEEHERQQRWMEERERERQLDRIERNQRETKEDQEDPYGAMIRRMIDVKH